MVLKLLNIEKFTQDDYKDIVKAVFFLVLAIIGGWVGNTLGCTTQKLMINSMLAKHIVLFMIIYFAMDISNKDKKSPLMILKASVSIYVLFILFTKMNIYSTVVVFVLLAVIYIINTQISYLEKNNGSEQDIQKYANINAMLYKVVPLIIIVSFGAYFMKQREDYKKNWDTMKFIFGNVTCKGI